MLFSNLLKNFLLTITPILVVSATTACITKGNDQLDTVSKPTVIYGGARSSSYGFKIFPSPQKFARIIINISKEVGNTAVPSALWIVSVIGDDGMCYLEFPDSSGSTYDNISFSDTDKHEDYLNYFDAIGAKVFLQVEAGIANMEDLITLVLSRYKDHPSVVGFGIDVEWFPSNGDVANGDNNGTKLTNEDLIRYDTLVKSFNPQFRIFVKHWIPEYCGNGPVSDVIYIDDSQQLGSLDNMVNEFSNWAQAFYPNDVGFQVGYVGDYPWWGTLNNPIKDISTTLKDAISDQIVHMYWVDFTLHFDELKYLYYPKTIVPIYFLIL